MLGQVVNITSSKRINKHTNEQINNSYRSQAQTFFHLQALIVISTLNMLIINSVFEDKVSGIRRCGNSQITDLAQNLAKMLSSMS